MDIPITENLVLVRTSFSSDERWRSFLQEVQSPPEPFNAFFSVVDDRGFSGKSAAEVVAALPEDYLHPAVFIADEKTLTEQGYPCLLVGPLPEEVREFRALAREVASIDNNLSIANMGFEEFEQASGPDGIFRGFE
jgi:hypothetical protein